MPDTAPPTPPPIPPKVGDFFAPFFTVRFLTITAAQGVIIDEKTGGAVKLQPTSAGEVILSQGDTKVTFGNDQKTSHYRSFATKLQVTVSGGDPSGGPGNATVAELTLEPPWEDAVKLVDDPLIQLGTFMVIQWGYSSSEPGDTIQSEKQFFYLHKPRLEVSGMEVTITLTGTDIFSGSSTRRTSSRSFFRAGFSTDAKILAHIARKNNMTADFSLAPIPLEGDSVGIHKEKKKPHVVTQVEKDWHFFSRLCAENNASFFVSGAKVFIADNNYVRAQEAAYRLMFFTPLATARDIPIIGFTTQIFQASIFAPAAASELENRHTDEDMKLTLTDKIDPATMPDQTQMGQRTAAGAAQNDGLTIKIDKFVSLIPNPIFALGETGQKMSSPDGMANREEAAKYIARRAETLANMNMEVNIPGVPHITPMHVVRVYGVGKVFSGGYIVMKVVHKIGADGYECDLTLIREGSTGDLVAGIGIVPVSGGKDPIVAAPGESVGAVGPDSA